MKTKVMNIIGLQLVLTAIDSSTVEFTTIDLSEEIKRIKSDSGNYITEDFAKITLEHPQLDEATFIEFEFTAIFNQKHITSHLLLEQLNIVVKRFLYHGFEIDSQDPQLTIIKQAIEQKTRNKILNHEL